MPNDVMQLPVPEASPTKPASNTVATAEVPSSRARAPVRRASPQCDDVDLAALLKKRTIVFQAFPLCFKGWFHTAPRFALEELRDA